MNSTALDRILLGLLISLSSLSFAETVPSLRNQFSDHVSRRLRTKTLICVGMSYDTIYVGGHPFACSDLLGRKFGGFGVGAGFGAGISGSVFVLIGTFLPGKDIVGTYSGGHASAAFGYYGAGVGLLFRNGETGVLPDPKFREKLIWMGYEAGLDLDFSAMEVAIGEW